MSSSLPPVRGQAHTFDTSLTSQADTKLFKSSVTLAAGDVLIYQDGALDGNIDSLPTEIGASGVLVVALSAAEMTADRITVRFRDAAGAEWCDQEWAIYTVAQTFDTIATNVAAVLADTGADGVLVASAAKTGYALTAAYDAAKTPAPTVGENAAAVWDRLTTALTTVGSAGAYLLAKLGLLSSATTVTVASPVQGVTVTTFMGDDYDAGDGRAIDWAVTTGATVVGGAIAVIINGVGAFAGSVVGGDTVRLELSDVQTLTISQGSRPYQVILTQLDSDVITLVEGMWISKPRMGA